MNLIQVNCSGCQKLFQVKSDDLSPGLVRFQCSSCQTVFTLKWPQPPGLNLVKAQTAQPPPFSRSELPPKICPRCKAEIPHDDLECGKCGVIFEKLAKLRPDIPTVRPFGPEVVKFWKKVLKDYGNTQSHEEFIQACLSKNNLHYASTQYRTILSGNPQDEIAKGMQARILELATSAYLATSQKLEGPERKNTSQGRPLFSISNICVFFGAAFIIIGLGFNTARPLIAVSFSVLVFVFSMKFFNR